MTPNDTLHPSTGIFNPTLRFAFTNITTEDFTSYWGGQPIVIKAGKTVELSHHLVVKLTRELVDKIMQDEATLEEVNYYKNNQNAAPNTFRSPKGMSLGIPAMRKVWEDKIVKELTPDEESPDIIEMRANLKAELTAAQNKEQTSQPVHVPSSINEFAELGKDEAPKAPKKALKLKEVK